MWRWISNGRTGCGQNGKCRCELHWTRISVSCWWAGRIDGKFVSPVWQRDSSIFIKSLLSHSFRAKCAHCFQFFDATVIKQHINEVHIQSLTSKRYFCDKCNFKATRLSRLDKHCQEVHKYTESKLARKQRRAETKLRKQCPTCGIFVKNLSEHQKMVHYQIKRFLCDFCNYSCYFKTKWVDNN